MTYITHYLYIDLVLYLCYSGGCKLFQFERSDAQLISLSSLLCYSCSRSLLNPLPFHTLVFSKPPIFSHLRILSSLFHSLLRFGNLTPRKFNNLRTLFKKPPGCTLFQQIHSPVGYTLLPEKSLLEVAKSILLIVSALFPIVNPIGGSPVFLALTPDYTTSARRLLAWRVALNSFVLIVASYLIGTHILAFFGISIPVVQVGGGLIVISNGWAILKQKDPDERGQIQKNMNPADILRRAFYPLTLPLTVGPGTISIAITLGANAPHHLVGANLIAILSAVIGSAIVAATIYLCYGFADRLAAVLGATGMNVILRLSSFLLVCIGVQIFWNGAATLLKTFLDSHA